MINFKNILTRLLKIRSQFVAACKRVQAFQERAWIVSIQKQGTNQQSILTDTFVVSEDSFSSPMCWMKKQRYSQEAVNKVDRMRRSQVIKIDVDGQSHSLIRVK
jgi:hypothetical protein